MNYDEKYIGLHDDCLTDALWTTVDPVNGYIYRRPSSIGHWTYLFERQAGISVLNKGVCGATTDNW